MNKNYLKQLRINLSKEIESACFELIDVYSMRVEVLNKTAIQVKGEYNHQDMDSDMIKSLNRLGKKLLVDGWDLETDVFIEVNTRFKDDYIISNSYKSLDKFLSKLNEPAKKMFFIKGRPNPLVGKSIASIIITFKLK